jgi:hypothetical protein
VAEIYSFPSIECSTSGSPCRAVQSSMRSLQMAAAAAVAAENGHLSGRVLTNITAASRALLKTHLGADVARQRRCVAFLEWLKYFPQSLRGVDEPLRGLLALTW